MKPHHQMQLSVISRTPVVVGSYSSVEMQSVYFTGPADWAGSCLESCLERLESFFIHRYLLSTHFKCSWSSSQYTNYYGYETNTNRSNLLEIPNKEIIHYYFTLWNVFSVESEWQLDFSGFQFSQYFFQVLGNCSKSSNYYWYHCHLHVSQLF